MIFKDFKSIIRNLFRYLGFEIILIKNQHIYYTEKFTSYKEAQKFSKIYYDENSTVKFLTPEDVTVSGRHNILPILVLSLNKRNIKILDYGGGANPAYSYIENSTKIKTKTCVIEQENFCKIIKDKVPNKYKKSIKYFSSLDQLDELFFDVVAFTSSIQYLEDYEKILDDVIKLKPLYILIARTVFHMGKEDYYTLEQYPAGSYHPYIFFSYDKLIKMLESKQYNLVFSAKYNINKYKHSTIDGKTFAHRNLLFKNKNRIQCEE